MSCLPVAGGLKEGMCPPDVVSLQSRGSASLAQELLFDRRRSEKRVQVAVQAVFASKKMEEDLLWDGLERKPSKIIIEDHVRSIDQQLSQEWRVSLDCDPPIETVLGDLEERFFLDYCRKKGKEESKLIKEKGAFKEAFSNQIRIARSHEFFTLQRIYIRAIENLFRSLFTSWVQDRKRELFSSMAEEVVRECRDTFPVWLFSIQQIRAVFQKKLRFLHDVRAQQFVFWIHRYSFLWLKTLAQEERLAYREHIPSIRSQLIKSIHEEFPDLEWHEEAVISHFEQECSVCLAFFQTLDPTSLLASSEADFHRFLQQYAHTHREETWRSIRETVNRCITSQKILALVDEVKQELTRRNLHKVLREDELMKGIIDSFVAIKVSQFTERHQPEWRGRPYPCLFPDNPDHKGVFLAFCQACLEEMSVTFGKDCPCQIIPLEKRPRLIQSSAHEAFNYIIREIAKAKSHVG